MLASSRSVAHDVLLGVALARVRVARDRAAHVRKRVADRRQQTSQQANAAADKTIYQAVDYTNKNKKGPALVVIPGEIKSNNATFLQKFTANNIADFGELELSNANFQVLERSNLGPLLNEFDARLQPGRSAGGAQVPRHGQAQDAPSTS